VSLLHACIESNQSQLLFKTIKRLGFVLATQTPNGVISIRSLIDEQQDDEMEFLKTLDPEQGIMQTLSSIEKIIETISDLIKF
jgi:hypothetical protein